MQNSERKIQDSCIPHATCFTLRTTGLLVIFLLPTYLIRFSAFGVPTNMLDALLVIFLVASIPLAIQKIQLSPKIILILTLILTGVLTSAARGGFSASELGIIKSWFVLPILFAVFYFSLFQKQKDRQTILWAYIFSAFAVSVIALGYFFAGDTTYDGRLRAFYESPNQLAMYTSPAFVLLWFFWKQNHKTFFFPRILHTTYYILHTTLSFRSFIFSILLCMCVALYLTNSYGAWIAILISILAGEYLLSAQKRAWVKIFSICAGIIIILAATQFKNEKLHDLATLDSRSSLASREMIWRAAWDIGKDNWLLGIGPGNFQAKYLEYQKFYPPYLEWAVPQPHNLSLAFWLQTGLLGFVGFLFIVASGIWRIMSLLKNNSPLHSIRHCESAKQSSPHTKSWIASQGLAMTQGKGLLKDNARHKKTATLLDIAVSCALLTILLHGLIDTPYWKNDLSVVFWVFVFFMMSTTPATEDPPIPGRNSSQDFDRNIQDQHYQ